MPQTCRKTLLKRDLGEFQGPEKGQGTAQFANTLPSYLEPPSGTPKASRQL